MTIKNILSFMQAEDRQSIKENEKMKTWLTAKGSNVKVVCAESLDDAHKQNPSADTFQCMSEYHLTSYSGNILRTLYYQFYNGLFIIYNENNTKIFKVEESYEFTYKFYKTKVLASGGYAGLLNWVNNTTNDTNNPFNRYFYNLLESKLV